MKRVLTFLVLLLSVVAVYAGGIKNAKDLAAFAKAVNKGESKIGRASCRERVYGIV